MGRAGLLGLAVAALSLGEAACLVQITHLTDPRPIFGEARAEAERRIDWDDDDAFDGDRRAKDHVREALRHVRLEDLEKAGVGILAEVEEEGGDQVLVWLR